MKISQKILYHKKGKGFQGINGSKVEIKIVIKGISDKNIKYLLYLKLYLILWVEFINWDHAKKTHMTAIKTHILKTDSS